MVHLIVRNGIFASIQRMVTASIFIHMSPYRIRETDEIRATVCSVRWKIQSFNTRHKSLLVSFIRIEVCVLLLTVSQGLGNS